MRKKESEVESNDDNSHPELCKPHTQTLPLLKQLTRYWSKLIMQTHFVTT